MQKRAMLFRHHPLLEIYCPLRKAGVSFPVLTESAAEHLAALSTEPF